MRSIEEIITDRTKALEGAGYDTEAARRIATETLSDALHDLLDACDFALVILEGLGCGVGGAAKACRAAIAKAEGRDLPAPNLEAAE